MSQLPPGTIVECEEFIGLSVGDDMVAVLSSEYFDEGSIVYLKERGSNDWVLTRHDGDYDGWRGWLISRDWNGRVRSREFDLDAEWQAIDELDDWDYELIEYLDRYQDYDY